MTIAILKGFLIFVTLLFGFVALVNGCHGRNVSPLQNALWTGALSAFITLQWLLP